VRILQVSEAAGGGLLGVVSSLAGGLVEQGHEVAFAYGRRPETPADMDAAMPEGVETFALPWGERTLRSHIEGGQALRRLVEEWEPDLVHLHSSFTGVVGTLVLGRRVPTIYSPHAYAFAGPNRNRLACGFYRAAEWMTARRCDIVGAVSDAEADLARRALNAPRVVTVANGIYELDPPVRPAPGGSQRELVVGMGRITAQQRPEESAAILSSLTERADVRWIGGAPDGTGGALEAARVPVTGWLDHDEACRQLGEAAVFLHWSAWDGQSIAVLEAMARDIVVVASDIPANREILGADAVCADPESATELIRAVLSDPGLREEMLHEQRRRRSRWGAHRMVDEWLAVYEELVGAPAFDYDRLPIAAAPDRESQVTVSWS
jgi:glycosyltransferase involved in cell wall biosynthesis